MLSTIAPSIFVLTACGLSSSWLLATSRLNRVERSIIDNHFALLTLKLHEEKPTILKEYFDVTSNQCIGYEVSLLELQL